MNSNNNRFEPGACDEFSGYIRAKKKLSLYYG